MAPSANKSGPSPEWTFIINHVFLPPKLPQSDDSNTKHEKFLLKTTFNALVKFRIFIADDQRRVVDCASEMIRNFELTLDASGAINGDQLELALNVLRDKMG